MIDISTSLNKVAVLTGSREFGFMIRMGNGFAGSIAGTMSCGILSRLSKGVWNASTMVSGLEFVCRMNRDGKSFYPLYTEEEIRRDPGKKYTGMAAFLQKSASEFFMIIPGGGYSAVASVQEGYPVAEALYNMGFSSFVLQYRIGKNGCAPNPMEDAARAISVICSHSKEWKLNVDNYGLIGFSAGGHLAAYSGLENASFRKYGLPLPLRMILGYPVITMGQDAHTGSVKALLGKHPSLENIEKYSVEKQITPSFPRTYVWQCMRDNTVSVENSRVFAKTLNDKHVPCMYDTFDSDAHGWGLGIGTPAEGWLDKAVKFVTEKI